MSVSSAVLLIAAALVAAKALGLLEILRSWFADRLAPPEQPPAPLAEASTSALVEALAARLSKEKQARTDATLAQARLNAVLTALDPDAVPAARRG